jgi:hypothetical protein
MVIARSRSVREAGGTATRRTRLSGTPAKVYALQRLSRIQLRALVAFAGRCARRVQFVWGALDLDASERRQLERAIEITENVGAGSYSHLDACRAEGVEVEHWSPHRPDFSVSRTAPGAAIYALTSACCETSTQAATPVLLALREAHFAAGGDCCDLLEAEDRFALAWKAPPGSTLRLVALGIRHDLDQIASITVQRRERRGIAPASFGPLWPHGAPPSPLLG